jgi:hypothetical protein
MKKSQLFVILVLDGSALLAQHHGVSLNTKEEFIGVKNT